MAIEFDYGYFNDNQSDFEMAIDDFKECLKKQVKEEIKNKIETLTKRNIELEERQKKLSNLEKEYKDKIRKLDSEKENIIAQTKRDIYKANVNEFLDLLFEHKDLYSIGSDYILPKKCSCCDENRKIILSDELGRKYKVNCKCSERYEKYKVVKGYYRLYFRKWRAYSSFDMICYYRESDESSWVEAFSFTKDGLKNNLIEKFDENNPPKRYHTVFSSEEEAQKCVDYLNKIEEKKRSWE